MPQDPSSNNLLDIPEGRLTAFQTVLMSGGLILLLVVLYEMREFMNPPLAAAATAMMFWPLRRYRTVRAILFTVAFLLFMWFLDELSAILLPFATVYLLAYLFDPAVSYCQSRLHVPRWVTSLAATLLLVATFGLVLFLLIPSIVNQIEVLGFRLIDAIADLRQWLQTTTALDRLEETGLLDKEEVLAQITLFLNQQATALARGIPNAVQGLLSSFNVVLGIIMIAAVMPVVHFYLLKDYPFIKLRLVQLFPTFGGRRDYLMRAGGIIGQYLRGQFLISAIAAFNVSVALIILDVPFALLIGIITGVLNMIPNLGIIITYVIAILITSIFGDPWFLDVVKVAAVLMAEQLLEASILTPNILSYHVGLHPVLIVLALFVFGYFMGIIGLLIAVPATALVMMVYKTYRDELSIELADADDSSSQP